MNRFLHLTGRLTFDDLLSDSIVELLLSGVGLEHAVKVIRFALRRDTVQSAMYTFIVRCTSFHLKIAHSIV